MTSLFTGQFIKDLPQFEGTVGASAKLVMHIPRGPEYHMMWLKCLDSGGGRNLAEIATDIDWIELKMGSRSIWRLSGAEVSMLAQYYLGGTAAVSPGDNGYLPIFFAREWMANGPGAYGQIDEPALGTANFNSVNLHVTLSSGTGITAISGLQTSYPLGDLGQHITISRITDTAAGSGVKIIQGIDKMPGKPIAAIHVSDANISDIALIVDGTERIKCTRTDLHQLLTKAGRTPQSGYTHLDFLHRNRFDDLLDTGTPGKPDTYMQSLALELTFTSPPGDFDLLIERVEQ